jgi:hypothetical protein
MINPIRMLTEEEFTTFKPDGATLHIENERFSRKSAYAKYMSGKIVYAFEVDNHHKNGNEYHFINFYGLVYIFNKQSKKLITITHPRGRQLYHYFSALSIPIPNVVHSMAKELDTRNKRLKLNNA